MWKFTFVAAVSLLGTQGLAQETAGADEVRLSAPKGPDLTPIINGSDATVDEYPMTGGLVAEGKIGSLGGMAFLCSSTLIAPDVVLTAGHCVDIESMIGIELDELKFHYIRDFDLTRFSFGSSASVPSDAGTGEDYVVHPEYVGAQGVRTGLSPNHDIALVFLDEVVDHPFAYLPTPDEVEQIIVGLDVAIVGWGQQTSDQNPPPGTVQLKQQADSFIAEIGTTEFKVGEEKEDGRKCHGDSGGPTFAWVETDALEDMRVIGVTSHAYDMTDCRETGGVDTRVSAYLDWIDEEMRSRCQAGTRAWCDQEGIIVPPMPEAEDTGDGEEVAGGCACDESASLSGFWLAGLLLAFARRRQ